MRSCSDSSLVWRVVGDGLNPMVSQFIAIMLVGISFLFLSGCRCGTDTDKVSESNSVESPEAKAFKRGQIVYNANCIACHNRNPKLSGSLGPDVWGSSKELLEARLLRAEYPPGYTPKRKSNAMAALPHLAPEIENLTVFLNQTP